MKLDPTNPIPIHKLPSSEIDRQFIGLTATKRNGDLVCHDGRIVVWEEVYDIGRGRLYKLGNDVASITEVNYGNLVKEVNEGRAFFLLTSSAVNLYLARRRDQRYLSPLRIEHVFCGSIVELASLSVRAMRQEIDTAVIGYRHKRKKGAAKGSRTTQIYAWGTDCWRYQPHADERLGHVRITYRDYLDQVASGVVFSLDAISEERLIAIGKRNDYCEIQELIESTRSQVELTLEAGDPVAEVARPWGGFIELGS